MSVIVAGGGTAGWLAALHVKQFYSGADVTVVYDDKTPIIGVGESTTAHFVRFLEAIDISVHEVVKNCEATIKNSIRFTNWKGDGTYYHHAFTRRSEECVQSYFDALYHDINLDDIDLGSTLSKNNKVPMPLDGNSDEPYDDTNYALHFNAKKMSEYLQSVGVSRGIKIVVGKIKSVSLDPDEYVTDITLDTNQTLKTDFVFDCTGFARVFVNKVYNSPVKSYKEILPVKKAMPFFIDNTGTTPPFTEAIAMKYGWMWKIPVGKRYGCGYVFDSDYINDEEAYEEICEVVKQKPHVPRTISFKPEYNTKPFNKNTLALGLAHGFLEPLEATSLLILANMLNTLERTGHNIFNRMYNDEYTESYNKHILDFVENCVDIVYVHYLTPRNDTEFWRKFKNMIPEHVSNTLEQIKRFDIKNPGPIWTRVPYDFSSYLKCMGSVNYIDKDTIKRNAQPKSYHKVKKNISIFENVSKNSKDSDDYIIELSNI